jgi:PRC-barrel domain
LHSETRTDGFTEVEDRFAGYTVYDHSDQKIGKVDDLFVDGNEHPEYIGVKMGFLGTRSTLIPFQMATVDDERQAIVVSTARPSTTTGRSPPSSRTRSTPTTASSAPPPPRRVVPTPTTPRRRALRTRTSLGFRGARKS